jgi:hypothetical protein
MVTAIYPDDANGTPRRNESVSRAKAASQTLVLK